MKTLIAEINKAWRDAYPDSQDVTDEDTLCMRVRSFADDRECWRFNASVNQKENNRLERELKKHAS